MMHEHYRKPFCGSWNERNTKSYQLIFIVPNEKKVRFRKLHFHCWRACCLWCFTSHKIRIKQKLLSNLEAGLWIVWGVVEVDFGFIWRQWATTGVLDWRRNWGGTSKRAATLHSCSQTGQKHQFDNWILTLFWHSLKISLRSMVP